MDRPKLLVAMIIVTSLLACEPPVTFTEPQPAGSKPFKTFPKRMTGTYVCITDSSKLCITEKRMIRTYDWSLKICLADLDSNLFLSGDTLIDTRTNEKAFVKAQGDSLIMQSQLIDTLFEITPEGILTKFKGYYFINREYSPGQWEVKKMNLSKGILSLSSISDSLDLATLHQIAENPVDTQTYHFEIDGKHFRKFIKQDGFSETELFVKTK